MGFATLGIMGFEGCAGYGAVGNVVNLATLLCTRAAAGQILVNQAVHASAPGVAGMQSCGDVALPEFPSPVATWVVGSNSAVAPSDADPVVASGPPGAAAGEPGEGDAAPGASVFREQPDGWLVVYEGQEHRFRESKGLRYLASLLLAPGREFHVADLAMNASAGMSRAVLGTGDDIIDAKARTAYQRRIEELRAERELAAEWGDVERAARAEDEIDWITRELATAYGLGGRARRNGDGSERVRKAVTNRIHHGITTIQHVHPVLGRHLANAVRTGTFCSYQPERPVRWNG